jgi:uncharacterized protein involved in exopolysaccharide biosynthesis
LASNAEEGCVIRKLFEALFRYKWLVLLPPTLIPLVVTPVAIMMTPPYYESVVGVWVDTPTYLDVKGNNPFVSAALTTSTQLSELLHTRAFMLDVVNRTSLAPLLATRAGEARARELLDKGVAVAAPSGGHLLTIRSRFSTPQLAYQVAQAVVDAYKDRSSDQQLNQSGIAISFFQAQLENTQDDLTRANQQLSQYSIAMGYASGDGGTASPDTTSVTAMDPKFAELQAATRFAQQQVDQARAALQTAQLGSAASIQGAEVGFQVLDPPQVPTTPATQLKNIVVYVAAALVLGLGISGMLLVLFVAGDRSIRRDADLQPPVRVLGTLPMLKLKRRLPKSLRPSATRRAIGFVAGAALPAPKGAK